MTRAPDIGTHGQPFCSGTSCPMYDGKRCRETGFQPDSICEPAVVDMAAENERMRPVVEAAKELVENWRDVLADDVSGERLENAIDAYLAKEQA